MNEIGIALIGCGKQAPKHINGLQSVESSNLKIYVSDLNQDQARDTALRFGVEYISEIDEVFNNPSINAVDICTPLNSHFELAKRAITSGKHVFCEKPLVGALSEAEELERLQQEHGKQVMVGYLYRYAPKIRLFKELLGNQEFIAKFGQPVCGYFRIGGRGSHQAWKHRKATGGGAINEMLVHMVDLSIWLFGPIKNVKLLSKHQLLSERLIAGKKESVDAEDFVIVELETESGILLTLQADMLTPNFDQYVEIQGTKGSFSGSINPDHDSYIHLPEKFSAWEAGRQGLSGESINMFEGQMNDFVEAVVSNNFQKTCSTSDTIELLEVLNQLTK